MVKLIRKYKYILLPCIAAVLEGVGVSFAAYTSMDSIRRVIITREATEVNAFYSNHMTEYPVGADSQITTKLVGFSDTDAPKLNITVSNYPNANPTRVNKRDIHYRFQAELLDKSGNPLSGDLLSKFQIERNGSGKKYSFAAAKNTDTEAAVSISDGVITYSSELLPSGTATQDVFMIYMTADAMEQVYIKVQAVPTDSTSQEATGQKALGRILSPTVFVQKDASWTGSFTDEQVSKDPKKLYGINYAVSGGGEGDITITWNADYLELSPDFWNVYANYITEQKITGSDGNESDTSENSTPKGENYIKLHIEADDPVDYFAMVFYRTQAAPETEGWHPEAGTGGSIVPDASSAEGAYIRYSFQPKTEETTGETTTTAAAAETETMAADAETIDGTVE